MLQIDSDSDSIVQVLRPSDDNLPLAEINNPNISSEMEDDPEESDPEEEN